MTDDNKIVFSVTQARDVRRVGDSFEVVKEAPTLEEIVDRDIDAFARYFCGELKNDSLSKAERSIIKTYLWWKTHQENPGGQEDSDRDHVRSV